MSAPFAWTPTAWFRPAIQRLKSLRAARTGQVPTDAVREAAAVREFAYRHLNSDPGFAADLFAAADRHEQMAIDENRA